MTRGNGSAENCSSAQLPRELLWNAKSEAEDQRLVKLLTKLVLSWMKTEETASQLSGEGDGATDNRQTVARKTPSSADNRRGDVDHGEAE